MEFFATLGPSLLFRSPMLVAWLVGIIISAYMLKKGGGKAERLLLIGCCLMFAGQLLSPFAQVLTTWFMAEHGADLPVENIGLIIGLSGIPLTLMTMAGIVSLVFAFWTRWKSQGATQQTPMASDNHG